MTNTDLQNVPVFCISLKDAAARRKSVSLQIKGLGFQRFTFFDAVNGRSRSVAEWEACGIYAGAISRERNGRDLTCVDIGCTLSHIELLKTIADSKESVSLVLEDDVIFDSSQLETLDLGQLPDDWDIVFLHALYAAEPPAGHVSGNLFNISSYGGSTVAYIVNPKGAAKLLRFAIPLSWPADGFMGAYMRDAAPKDSPVTYNAYMIWPPAASNGSLDKVFNRT